jgi:tRNA-dihydrouridine synthase B
VSNSPVATGLCWTTLSRPIVALAPMAGVTDAPFRQFMKQLCPSAVLFTEFLSTDAIAYGAQKTLKMMEFDPALEYPFIVQVFGHDPEHFLEAAKVIEQAGASGIDINMGCPAAKVVSSCHGAALIREPQLAAELVHATKKAVSIPVSVKTRLGWDRIDTLQTFCRGLVDAGAQALSIHGRRFCDKFTGDADWGPIYALKEAFPQLPILGNGDIKTARDALEKLGNLDGVMVGRGTWGNPWLLQDIVDAFASGQAGEPTVQRLTFVQKVPVILAQAELAVRLKGEYYGLVEMRRHLGSYVKGFEGAAQVRSALMQVTTLADTRAILESVLSTD